MRRVSPGSLENVYAEIEKKWGSWTPPCIQSHSPRKKTCMARNSRFQQRRFSKAMDISCHSFIRMARLAEPLMKTADRSLP